MDETCRPIGDPDHRAEQQLDALVEHIEEYGWAIQWVQPDGGRAPLAYTVGLTALGRPELVVTGTGSADSAELLNTAATQVAAGLRLNPGTRWRPAGLPTFEAIGVAVPDVHLRGACALYGDAVRAVQLVYRDADGRWPWEPGHRPPAWRQYLLGPRSPVSEWVRTGS